MMFGREAETGCAYLVVILIAAFIIVLLASFNTWPVVLSYWPFGLTFVVGWFFGATMHHEAE